MNDSGAVFHCQRCGLQIDPDSENVVQLVRWMRSGTPGSDVRVEGVGHLFHVHHAPGEDDEWRPIP